MANRRMFSTGITNSDAFLDMPDSAQNLYFHLGMGADDDGFVGNPKMIMRVVRASDDDYKILVIKKFVIIFENGICVIKHWRINNQIRKDRYTETKYIPQKTSLFIKDNGSYTQSEAKGLPVPRGYFTTKEIEKDGDNYGDNSLATTRQPSIVKVSKVKVSIGKNIELPEWLNKDLWSEWVEFRQAKKKPLTPISIKKQIEFLSDFKDQQKEIINSSIMNGYQGLFPPKQNQKKTTTNIKTADRDDIINAFNS
jgi:hypothetical protein